MPIPFLNSIKLNKNQVEDFCVFNYSGDPTLSSGADFGYLWLNTSATPKVLKFWDGTNYRTLIDSTTISTSTAGLATDLAGGGAGQIVYQNAANDTMFLSAGTSGQVLSSNGASAPSWLNQSSLSVGSATTATTATTATNVAGGSNGSILVQSGAGTTGQLAIGANGYILTSNGTTPVWSASIPSSSVSGLAASATTDTTNASNISSGTLGLARLSLATDQFYVGDASNNPAATAKSSIRLSGFGTPNADVAMGGFKITGLADPVDQTDAATRKYVDEVAQGLDVKASCLTATTANIDLSAPTASIGGVTISTVDSRVLVKDQTDKKQNGIYLWKGAAVAMTRSLDADTVAKLVGAFTFVEQGTNADSGWVCQVDGGTIGSVDIEWTKFSQAGSYTAGNGMALSGGQFSFATSSPYTTGQIPYASSSSAIGFKSVTGTGDVVLATSPTLITPALGTPTSGNLSSCTGLPLSTGVSGTLPVANGGTGATTFTQGQVLFAGASTISSSANLFWDNTNGYLGIGTPTPASTLDVNGASTLRGNITVASGATSYGTLFITSSLLELQANSNATNGLRFKTTSGTPITLFTNDTERLRIASDGVCTWSNVGGVAGTAMTLNGSGLGVGVTPSARLHTYISDGGTNNLVEIARLQRATTGTAAVGFGQYLRFDLERGDGANEVAGFIGTKWSNATAGVSKGDLIFGGSDNGAVTTTMVLDASGNLGVGATTPGYKLHVNAANPGNGVIAQFYNNATSSLNGAAIILTQYGIADWYVGQPAGVSALEFGKDKTSGAAGTGLMRLTAEGNLGLGVTPKNWSTYKAFDLPNAAYISSGNSWMSVMYNAYLSSSGYLYKGNGYASHYLQQDGQHIWYNAISGNSDAAVTFTPRMTLDASGNLLLNRASTIGSNSKLNVQLHGTSASTYSAPSNAAISVDAGTSDNCVIALVGGGDQGIYRANSSGAYDVGISLGSNAERRIQFNTAATTRLSIKSTGQVNFVGLASDPAGAAGDVYYNSTAKALKLYATDWKTLPRKAVVQGGAGTGTTIAVAHNLNTNNVSVTVLRTTDNVVVFTDVAITDADTVTITFASAVTKADYTITVIG